MSLTSPLRAYSSGGRGGSPSVRVPIRMHLNLSRTTEPLGMHCKAENGTVIVTGVVRGSAAEVAGIRTGDCVKRLGGYIISDSRDMRRGRVVALDRGELVIPMDIERGASSTPSAHSYYSPTYTPSPDTKETKQLGSLQAAYDNGALTREEFRAAVTRIKGFSPWPVEGDLGSPQLPPPTLSTPEPPTTHENADKMSEDDRFRRTQPSTEPPPVAASQPPPQPQPVIDNEPSRCNVEEDEDKKYPELSPEELQNFPKIDPDTLGVLKQEFSKYDANGDGVLTDKELLRAFLAAGMDPQTAHYTTQHALLFADGDGDGTIDYKEFVEYHAPQGFEASTEGDDAEEEEAAFLADIEQSNDTQLSPEMIAQLTADFTAMDENGDGYLTEDEIRAAIESAFGNDSAAIAAGFLLEADRDGDGRISYKEFLADAGGGGGGDSEIEGLEGIPPELITLISDQFASLDANGDGFLSEAELQQAIGDDGSPEAAMVLQSILQHDRDGDGKINYKEFMQMQFGV